MFFVASWTGVVKYHGPRPSRRPKQVRFSINILLYVFMSKTCLILC
jgi:hypothetical protein